MKNYLEIYPGGIRTGEIVIGINCDLDENGCAWLTEDEYDAAFGHPHLDRNMRSHEKYHEGYDVTSSNSRPGWVLVHPGHYSMAFIGEHYFPNTSQNGAQ